MKVTVFGLGYVGCVSAACLATIGHEVIGVDVNPVKVDLVARGRATVVEEQIGDLTAAAVRSGALRATGNVEEAIATTDISLICVGTPSAPNGSLSTSYLERVAQQIVEALALIDRCRERGLFSRLIGDDQLLVADHAGRLVCRAPAAIAGLVEVPGFGPRPMPSEPSGVIDLQIRLVPDAEMVRFQEDFSEPIAGRPVPRIDLAERNVAAALLAVMSRLSIAPFV
jgi:hypothetical protein